MKIKRLLPICLLALSLTACDLSSLMGGANKKSSEESSLNNGAGYQGKQGATELSKEEWELAFSLEEFALRRNCHLQVTQDEREMNLDVDNGKFKIDVPTYAQYPFYMHFTGMSGDDIQGVQYYPNDDGTYSIHEDQVQLNLGMAEFGLIYLEYNSFTYDSSSKIYKADNYHYEITYKGQTALSLDCEDCEVTIEDGFPKKLECTIVEGADGDRSGVHYEANYSRYNAINVTLPDGNNNNNGGKSSSNPGLPEFDGKEISFDVLSQAYKSKGTANYNSAILTVHINDGEGMNETVNFTASKVDGVWVADNADYESMDLSTMIITDEMMNELAEEINDPQYDLHFYQKANGYVITMSEEYVTDSETGATVRLDVQLHINEYFYVTAEYLISGGVYEGIEIQWRA